MEIFSSPKNVKWRFGYFIHIKGSSNHCVPQKLHYKITKNTIRYKYEPRNCFSREYYQVTKLQPICIWVKNIYQSNLLH